VTDGIRLGGLGLDDDPDVECVRMVTSVALVALDPAALPAAPLIAS
jgi:hypothetical protein